jgi:hypothetical protein
MGKRETGKFRHENGVKSRTFLCHICIIYCQELAALGVDIRQALDFSMFSVLSNKPFEWTEHHQL